MSSALTNALAHKLLERKLLESQRIPLAHFDASYPSTDVVDAYGLDRERRGLAKRREIEACYHIHDDGRGYYVAPTKALPAKPPMWPVIRSVVLFVGGLLGVLHEVLLNPWSSQNPALLMVFAAMMGLPAFFAVDAETHKALDFKAPPEPAEVEAQSGYGAQIKREQQAWIDGHTTLEDFEANLERWVALEDASKL